MPSACCNRIILPTVLLAALLLSSMAQAAERVRLNIASFEKHSAGFTYDPIITGTYAHLFDTMQGKADVVFLTRTAPLLDKDVVNLQVDALRMASNDKLANEGLNCQFSFDNESDEDSEFYSIAGVCSMLKASEKGTVTERAFIKRITLAEANYGNNVWLLVYEDKKRGVAIYADVDPE